MISYQQANLSFCSKNERTFSYRYPEKRCESGFAILHEVARRRIETVGEDLTDVILPEAIDPLIAASGGVLRHFVKLIKQAMLQAEYRERKYIIPEDAQWAIQNERKRRSVVLTDPDKRYLLKFQDTRTWDDEDRFLSHVHAVNILAYAEAGRVWHEIHPILLPTLKEFKEEQEKKRDV
jgi:hypothetical protein